VDLQVTGYPLPLAIDSQFDSHPRLNDSQVVQGLFFVEYSSHLADKVACVRLVLRRKKVLFLFYSC